MPKIVKGHAGKKPPEPAADHSVIEEWVPAQMPGIQPLLKQLDELICATIPKLEYVVNRNRALYGLPKLGWIIEIAPYHVSANVLFHGGAEFDAPPELGDVDRTRYIKIGADDDVDVTQLRKWIKQAARTPGWK